MKTITFYNNFHNGDLFFSKSFIREIISSIETKFYYAHRINPIIFSDLLLESVPINPCYDKNFVKFFEDESTVYVNTWIGCYFDENKPYYGECSLRSYYQMFEEIYEYINSQFSSNLNLSSIENYFSFVDYSKYNCDSIDTFLSENNTKKVLFSNGPCWSGQSTYDGDMSPIIEFLAQSHPDMTFIATQSFDTTLDNIKFTNDIINSVNGHDLNEISYISKFCDMIVGRNSGPFCFCLTKENLFDSNKIFYAFGERETDCFNYCIDVDSKCVFRNFDSIENLQSSILDLINNFLCK